MRLFTFACAAVAALGLAWPASAAWHRASTRHFVIYSEQQPERLRAFAERLEKFDTAVRLVRKMPDHEVGDGNRLTIFVVSNAAAVRKIVGDKSGFLSGFYRGRAAGSIAFAPQVTGGKSGAELGSDTVLFHEYAHHLMAQDIDTPYPEWLVEGFAEFMSTARFDRDGSIGLGIAPKHRAYGLFELKALSWPAILAGMHDKMTNDERESFYGRGWLLTHFLTFEPSRKGQLDGYLTAIAKGVSPVTAAAAFGNLGQLEKDLDAYMKRSRLQFVKIGASVLPPKQVEISTLTPGAAAILPRRMELKNGVSKDALPALVQQIRAVAASYPGDPLVETTLAEAELTSGNGAAAEAAANRALKVTPRDIEAMILMGRALLERLSNNDNAKPADFAEARQLFMSANKLDTEDPEPLIEYYKSYLFARVRPTANAIAALHYASNLAPQDVGLRINSAMQYLRDGKVAEARRTLVVVAYDPHAKEAAEAARRMIGRIDAGDAKGAERAGFSH